jgi:hypothetical protein
VSDQVTDDEAEQILSRFNNSHWRDRGNTGEQARYSIPANPDRDDDIRLAAYIEQTRGLRKRIAGLEAAQRFIPMSELAPMDGQECEFFSTIATCPVALGTYDASLGDFLFSTGFVHAMHVMAWRPAPQRSELTNG